MGEVFADDPQVDVGADLVGLRPGTDRVRMEAVRARAERALFGAAEPARLGRFVLIERIAGGGMGVVYAAYDPQLDRKVALKVLHPRQQDDDRARQRLVAEAQALARLDHRNVVKVHDVITHEGQVVIVMELVAGQALAAWERQRARTWREIVEVYARAGEGLAAAHGVGVIHRDFKPANAIVGDDGRVRVLDFGLARFTDVDPAGEPGLAAGSPDGRSDPAGDLTATGDVVGTLGFTSPEQLAGEVATPASDQFSFCVALHRAIEGEPPFDGADMASLSASIHAGTPRLAQDGRRLPAWLRAAIARGLRAAPDARFPSMTALLTELRRPRGWRRWRVPVIATAVAGAMLTAGLAIGGWHELTDPLAACDGGAAELAAVWGDAARARVETALESRGAVAPAIRGRVLDGLDAYGSDWRTQHRAACVDHRRGIQSADLLDRRMLCLRQRLGDLGAAVTVLGELGPGAADRAVDVVVELPPIEQCGDVERLQAERPPPSTPALQAQVDRVRADVSHAEALDRAGRSAEARAAAERALGQARTLGYPAVVAEAALAQGRILLEQRDFTAAAGALSQARAVALEQRLLPRAVEAAARLIYVRGLEHPDLAALAHDAAVFEPMSKGLPGTDHHARPLLLNNIGAAYMALERRDDAARYFQLAHQALEGVADPDPELSCVDKNLAMLTPDDAQREALARGVWERRRALLGDAHLQTLEALDSYARFLADLPRAVPLAAETCRGYQQWHPQLVDARVYCESYRAYLAELVGDRGAAEAVYTEVIRLAAGATDRETIAWRDLAEGRLALLQGDPDAARAAFARIVAAYASRHAWWQRIMPLRAEVGLAAVELTGGEAEAARARLEAAIPDYARIIGMSEDVEPRLRRDEAIRMLEAERNRATRH